MFLSPKNTSTSVWWSWDACSTHVHLSYSSQKQNKQHQLVRLLCVASYLSKLCSNRLRWRVFLRPLFVCVFAASDWTEPAGAVPQQNKKQMRGSCANNFVHEAQIRVQLRSELVGVLMLALNASCDTSLHFVCPPSVCTTRLGRKQN